MNDHRKFFTPFPPARECSRIGVMLASLLMIAAALAATALPVAAESMPQRGGTLRLALPTDVSSLDPAKGFDTISFQFLLMIFQGLVQYDEGVNIVPSLARDWSLSADRKTYTFHLQPGARFSNGRAVGAADFVYTLERTLDPKTAAPTESYFEGIAGAADFRAGKAAHISGLRAPRPDTVEIELSAPDPTFLYILTLPGALVVPREEIEKWGDAFATHPVGTGPYVLTKWDRAFDLRFGRNPRYAHPERQYLDAIDVRIGGDRTLHVMMFERGELDIAEIDDNPGIPVPDFLRLERSPRWHNQIKRIQAGATDFLSMNVEMPPFDDVRVRQAVNYAVNKEKLVRLYHGMNVAAKGILPGTMPGFNTNLIGLDYNPAKARQLVAAAGYTNGLSFKLWYRPESPLFATAIQEDLKLVGIHAELKPVSFAQLIESEERRKTVQCCVAAWSQDYPDPSDFLDVMFNGNRITEEGCQNTSFYNNPAVNKLLAEAATCPDPPQRLRLYQQAEQIIVTDAPYVPLDHAYTFALYQSWVHGLYLHPVIYFRFERMWLDR